MLSRAIITSSRVASSAAASGGGPSSSIRSLTRRYRSSNCAATIFVSASALSPSPPRRDELRLRHRHRHRHRPHRRFYSTGLTDRFWDVVESGSLDPSNPIMDDVERIFPRRGGDIDDSASASSTTSSMLPLLPDFSRVRARHLAGACERLQAEYDAEWDELEGDLARYNASSDDDDDEEGSSLSPEDVLDRIDDASASLRYARNVARLYGSLLGGDEGTKGASSSSSDVVVEMRHERSAVLGRALKKMRRRSGRRRGEGSAGRCETAAIDGLLRGMECRGVVVVHGASGDDDDENAAIADIDAAEMESIAERLIEAEDAFIALTADDRRPPSPKECLSLMYELLALRQERSKLLGYSSYAEWSLRRSSSSSSSSSTAAAASASANVDAMLSLNSRIAERLLPRVSRESAARYESDEMEREDLRPYFTLDGALGGMFDLSRKLFGIEAIEAAEEGEEGETKRGWHDDVRLFRVRDEDTGDLIGSFYLDPYRRPSKENADVVLPLLSRRSKYRSKPAMCMSINVAPPMWDTDPAYLTFDDVRGLFRTYGKVLRRLLDRDESCRLYGAQTMREDDDDDDDFVGKLMERFLYEEDILSAFAVHARTGRPLTRDQINDERELTVARRRIDLCRHVFRSQLELTIHSEFLPPFERSLVSVQKDTAARYIPHETLGRGDISPLLDIFETDIVRGREGGGGGGMGGGTSCHRHVWSEMTSADAFSAFQEAGDLGDRDEMRRVGMSFRKSVLEGNGDGNGGGDGAEEERYAKFRGRGATTEALFRDLGWI